MPDCWPNHCWLCTGCTCLCGFVDYSWLHCRGYIFALALCGCRCRFLQCNAMPQPHALVYSYSLLLWSAKGSCFRCCKKLSLEVSEWVWLCCNDQSWICCCHFFSSWFHFMFHFGVSRFPAIIIFTYRPPAWWVMSCPVKLYTLDSIGGSISIELFLYFNINIVKFR